jgi:hypothetical protein
MQQPNEQVFLTTYLLQRVLKQFAQRIVPDDSFSDGLVQIHMQQTNIPQVWSIFLVRNCANCSKEPNTCMFLNPTDLDVQGAATPGGTRAAIANAVESGTFMQCPAQDVKSEHKE